MSERISYAATDWRQLTRHQFVRRYEAYLLLATAGEMLCGAAMLWKGDHGAGRLAARRISDTAGDLFRIARAGRAEAYLKLESESINGLSEADAKRATQPIGELLGQYVENYAFRPKDPAAQTGILPKNPRASRRLAEMTVALVETAIHLLRSSYPDGKVALADRLEDTLEQLCTEEVLARPVLSPGEGYLKCMMDYALHGECQALCTAMSRLYIYASSDAMNGKLYGPQKRAWGRAASSFREKADERHFWFASLQSKAERFELSSISAVRNDAFGGSARSDYHLYGEGALRLCSEMASGLITVLLHLQQPLDENWRLPESLAEDR